MNSDIEIMRIGERMMDENKKFAAEIERKPYSRPEIVHELELETRAGSPLGLPDPLDLPEP
jgi:hypothetical protein